MNRILYDRAQSMILQKYVSRVFWAEEMNIACYLANKSPSITIKFKTHFEV